MKKEDFQYLLSIERVIYQYIKSFVIIFILTAIKFNCIYMFALGIVARIIWTSTNPYRLDCSDGISFVTRC